MDITTIDKDLLKGLPLPDWDEKFKSEPPTQNSRGTLLLVAGSNRLPGAAILAARAALRAGCGSVRLAAPDSVALHVGIAVPELMVIALPETSEGTISLKATDLLRDHLEFCTAIAVGPGLDQSFETVDFVRELLGLSDLPILVTGEALKAVKHEPASGPRILSADAQDFAGLTGEFSYAAAECEDAVAVWATQTGFVTLLKGAGALVALPDGKLYRNEAGPHALASAGSGDVLAGVIGGLLAQGVAAENAALWGAHLHGLAAEAVVKDGGDDGIMARDLIDRLPGIQKYLRRLAAPKGGTGFGLRSV